MYAGDAPVLVHNADHSGQARRLWELTSEKAVKVMQGGPFNTKFYKSSDGTWWTPDTAGHGGSKFKVFDETKKSLEWRADADQYGNYIEGKWKGDTGKSIPKSNLRGAQ